MKTEDKNYFRYMTTRNKISLILRKFMYSAIVREFNGKLLDIGSGIGEFLQWYPNSCGIDTNKFLVDYCKKRGFSCSFGSVYNIPFKDKTFNSVLCSHVLEHLNKPETAMREIKRVLRPGGKLIIILPTEKGYRRDKTHVMYWGKESIENLLKKFDFKIKKTSYYPTKILSRYTYLGELRVVAVK